MPSIQHDPVTSAASSADDIPAKLSKTILTSDCASMAVVRPMVGLGVGGLIVACVWYKWRRAKADSRRKTSHESETQRMNTEEQENIAQVVSSLQEQIRDLEAQRDKAKGEQKNIAQVMSSLQELIKDLEAQKHEVRGELRRVEAEREENERQLWLVEAEITEREKLFDKPEGLLRDKEKLLQAQWKLDETKRNTERRMLNIEKVLEPVEIQVSRMNRRRDV